jgi:AAA ATPase domain
MDPIRNPFAPGAGSPPPELSGRDSVREKMRQCLGRLRIGRPAKSIMLVGLRGVGKTVLLDQMMKDAEVNGVITIRIEAPEGRSLPAMLAPQLRLALLRLNRIAKATQYAIRGLRALAGFASKLKMTYSDIEVGFDYDPEPGLADNGDLEGDLSMLLEQVGLAAKAADTVVAIFIDELQYVEEAQLAALISALHRCSQKQLPLTVVGAGLPQLRGKMGEAKSYAERLFEFPEIGPLNPEDAAEAIVKPVEDEGAEIEANAVTLIIKETKGYPYFLQEWGKHAWDIAQQSPITAGDIESTSQQAIATLDESFFRVRFDRLTPKEKQYLRAMAELGPGPHRSGDIADELNRVTSSLGPIRSSLIGKGMIWSPTHGDTVFTVPLFDEFMKRIIPGKDWAKGDD